MKKIEKMQKKLNEVKDIKLTEEQQRALIVEYQDKLEADPKYSLKVDPENKYSMSDEQKKFVEYYTQFKDVTAAATMLGISLETAKSYLVAYSSQQEIRRINMAMYHRQFHTKLLTIEAIGGWLSSILMDENVPVADRLKTREKLEVARMIIDLNKYQQESLISPITISEKDLETQVKDLSVETLRSLVETTVQMSNPTEKNALIQQLNGNLTPEEEAYLRTLSTDELLQLINDVHSQKS